MTYIKDDQALLQRVDREIREQKASGLADMVGDLACIMINTEIDHHEAAAQELINYTGFQVKEAFRDPHFKTIVLSCHGSADILVRTRIDSLDPFMEFNKNPRSYQMPHTRLQTFVFNTTDIYHYVHVQKARGVEFATSKIKDYDHYYYIETKPSKYTGISFGILQWKSELRGYRHKKAKDLSTALVKPDHAYLADIHELDHVAVRVRSEHRDDAILEFMHFTNYAFDMAIYVENLNSITNVTRRKDATFALVFTSGIESADSAEQLGPTEKFIQNYGVRPHHMAFRTENIESVYEELKKHGMKFLVELVGDRSQGLKQTFTDMSPHTLLVNEYIRRYDDFTGFFSKNNVTLLTKATEKQ